MLNIWSQCCCKTVHCKSGKLNPYEEIFYWKSGWGQTNNISEQFIKRRMSLHTIIHTFSFFLSLSLSLSLCLSTLSWLTVCHFGGLISFILYNVSLIHSINVVLGRCGRLYLLGPKPWVQEKGHVSTSIVYLLSTGNIPTCTKGLARSYA